MAHLHTEELGPTELCVAPDTTTSTLPSPGASDPPERPAVSPSGPSPPRATPVQQEREEEEEGLNEFQSNMKSEHRQVSKSNHILERHRRKRITQSCSRLRQLLPTIPGGRVDMVTVLEMTVAYLQTIKQVSVNRPDIQLCPPDEVHADWLMQSHVTRDQGHKLATELQSKLRSQGTPKERRWLLRRRGRRELE